MAAWTELPPAGGLPECAALVELAERLRWSASELVVQYARRALAEGAGADGPLAVRAHALVAAALVRIGRFADAVEPGLAALRGADQAGLPELTPSIRLDMAACAHGLGEPLLGCTILRPVVESVGARPATRASAIAALVGCSAHVGRRDDLEDALAEAERLLAADDGLNGDNRRMERALLAVRTAAYHRLYGETEDAVDAARGGLGLLAKLRHPGLEGGRATAALSLELVCALLDDGELAEAERVARPVLAEPVRAASAGPVGRMLLALASRVHVPAGRVELGRVLLGDAGWIGERHDLDWLMADAFTAIAHLDELAGEPADALVALRDARAAEQRQLRSVNAAKRELMIEFGVRVLPLDAINSLLRGVISMPHEPLTSAPPIKEARQIPAPSPKDNRPSAFPPGKDTWSGAAGKDTRPGTVSPGRDTWSSAAPTGKDTRPGVVPSSGSASLPAARTPTSSQDAGAEERPEPAETDAATGLLTREGLSQRLQAVRTGNRPVALTLVRLDPVDGEGRAGAVQAAGHGAPSNDTDPTGPDALTTLAGRVRDIAPEDAELARSDGSELAVLLPHTTKDQAEEFAASIRESAIESDWLAEASGQEVSISTGVALSGPDSAVDEDADSLLTAARESLTPAESDRSHRPVDDLFLSTLEAAAGEAGAAAGYREIRDLLAPLLDHPALAKSESRATIPPEPEPDDVPDPPQRPDIILPKREPDQIPPLAPGPVPQPEVPGPTRFPADPDPDRPRFPSDPGPGRYPPDPRPDVPGPSRYPVDPQPAAPTPFPPDPGPDRPRFPSDPQPEVPSPTRLPTDPSPDEPGTERFPADPSPAHPGAAPFPSESPGPSAEPPNQDPTDVDTALGPIHGPEPRQDDRPARGPRRRDRSDTTSIADLLTEALVAYQETAPEEEPPPPPPPPPPPDPYDEYSLPRPTGRHRMPDWDSV